MKSVEVSSRTYDDVNKENDKEDPKFKVGDHVKTSKSKTYFCKRLHSKLEWRGFCN